MMITLYIKMKTRMKRNLERHNINEKWGVGGVEPRCFYNKWILWNNPSLTASIKHMSTRFKQYYVRHSHV